MAVIDHGKWLPYKPGTPPMGLPTYALFAQRESDQVDWYVYVHATGDDSNFGEQSVKGAAYWKDDSNCYIVGPATYDGTAIFPANAVVFEVTDYVGSDPQAAFGGKVYDPATGTFEEFVPPDPPATLATGLMAEVLARLEKLERK